MLMFKQAMKLMLLLSLALIGTSETVHAQNRRLERQIGLRLNEECATYFTEQRPNHIFTAFQQTSSFPHPILCRMQVRDLMGSRRRHPLLKQWYSLQGTSPAEDISQPSARFHRKGAISHQRRLASYEVRLDPQPQPWRISLQYKLVRARP